MANIDSRLVEIPDSFVYNKIKYASTNGNGEGKLYVGQRSEEQRLNDLFDVDTICFTKSNLKEYMDRVYLVYSYQIFGEYREADLRYWKEMYSEIDRLDEEVIWFDERVETFISGQRYYIRLQHHMFQKILRRITLPVISNLRITKYQHENMEKPALYFEILLKDNLEQNLEKDFKDLLVLDNEEEQMVELAEHIDKPHNRILYGAPGTGKSYLLDNEVDSYFARETNVERVTFYPGYTYGQFIGTYKPKPIYKDENKVYHNGIDNPGDEHEPIISYEYVPGILMRILVKALSNPDQNYCLIVEEINRVKVDSVFGDFFQLLDRDVNGKSEYQLKCTEEIAGYLKKNIDNSSLDVIRNEVLYLPSNLYIWATMNSADQGVYPMDTAFKRRWNFEYIGLNKGEGEFNEYYVELGGELYLWNVVRKFINDRLKVDIAEDRLLAPFFVKFSDFEEVDGKKVLKAEVFINKIVMYIKEDILRHRKIKDLFFDDNANFNDLHESYAAGLNILKMDETYQDSTMNDFEE